MNPYPFPKTLRRLALPLLVYKLSYFFIIYASLHLIPQIFNGQLYAMSFHWPPGEPVSIRSLFCTWDAQHYLFISRYGYRAETGSIFFFPLWPLLIRIGAVLSGGRYLLASLLLSNVLSYAALLVYHWVVARQHEETVADAALLLLLAYPGALFLAVPYSESLFLLLALLWFASRDGPWWAYAAASYLLPLSRPVGTLMLAPILCHVLSQRDPRRIRRELWRLIPPILGSLTYLGIMARSTGDPFIYFRFFAADSLLVRASISKLWDIPGFFRALTDARPLHGVRTSIIDRVWFLLLLPVLGRLWRKDRISFCYALVMGVVPAMTVSFWGYTRYFLQVFPAFTVGAQVLSRPERKPWLPVAAAAMFSLQVLFLLRHINFHWVG